MNHKMVEGNLDPKLVAVAKQEEFRKFEKLKVYEIAGEEDFKRDPKEIKIGTKWVVTKERHKGQPHDQSPLGGKGVCRRHKEGRAVCKKPRCGIWCPSLQTRGTVKT